MKAISLVISVALVVSLASLMSAGAVSASTDVIFEGYDGDIEIVTKTDQVFDNFSVGSEGDFMGHLSSSTTGTGAHVSTFMNRDAAFGSRITDASSAQGYIDGRTLSIQNEWGSAEDDGALLVSLISDTGGYYEEQNLGRVNTKMGFTRGGKGGWMNPLLIADGDFEINVSAERYSNLAGGGAYNNTYESGSDLAFLGSNGGSVSTFMSVGEQNACHSVQFGNKYMGSGKGEGWHCDLLQVRTLGEGAGSFTMHSEEITASYGAPSIDVEIDGMMEVGHDDHTEFSVAFHTATGLVEQIYEFFYNLFLGGYADTG